MTRNNKIIPGFPLVLVCVENLTQFNVFRAGFSVGLFYDLSNMEISSFRESLKVKLTIIKIRFDVNSSYFFILQIIF